MIATDTPGNTANDSVSVTLDQDLDDDGIANNVDGNSTVSPAVSRATSSSSHFSDRERGGQTNGKIVSLGAGVTVK